MPLHDMARHNKARHLPGKEATDAATVKAGHGIKIGSRKSGKRPEASAPHLWDYSLSEALSCIMPLCLDNRVRHAAKVIKTKQE